MKTTSNNESDIVSKYILLKYKQNIKQIIATVKIYPSDYRNEESLDKTWIVQFYPRSGRGVSPVQLKSYEYNGSRISINRIKIHKDKVEAAEYLRDYIIHVFKTDPRWVLKAVEGEDKAKELYPSVYGFENNKVLVKIKDAFEECYQFKINQGISSKYASDLKSVKNRFLKYHKEHEEDSAEVLSKKMILDFLKDTTKGTSNRNFNNLKTTIGVFMGYFYDNDYIPERFTDKIKNLKIVKSKNRAYTQKQVERVFNEVDDVMRFYLMHVYYGLMRPQTIVRLKAKDIDLERRMFDTDTKTGLFIKRITDPLYEIYKDLDLSDGEAYIFGYNGLLQRWSANDTNRRNRYTKLFKPIKDKLKLDKDYTIYSFRHSGIGKIFESKSQELKDKGVSDYINEACKFIMPLTNHQSIDQVKEYLRGFSMMVHVDWSEYQ